MGFICEGKEPTIRVVAYIIFNTVEELKSSTPQGIYERKEKINKINPDSLPKTTKKTEHTMNRNQESCNVEKQIKFSNLTLNSNSKEEAQLSIKKTDDARDTHP